MQGFKLDLSALVPPIPKTKGDKTKGTTNSYTINFHPYQEEARLGRGSFGKAKLVKNSVGKEYVVKVISYGPKTKDNLDTEIKCLRLLDEYIGIAIIAYTNSQILIKSAKLADFLALRNAAENKHDVKRTTGYHAGDTHKAYLLIKLAAGKTVLNHYNEIIDRIPESLLTQKLSAANSRKIFQRYHHIAQLDQIKIIAEMCRQLQIIHNNNILHRDIKGDNIILFYDPKTSKFEVKIIDFGLAVITDASLSHRVFSTAKVKGVAPELRKENAEVTFSAASDIYALGKTIAVLFPSQIKLARAMTAKDPNQRVTLAEIIASAEYEVKSRKKAAR